ncbi:MAG: ACT domain-containing protein [Cyanobacteria bacterium P01_A01_bin.105]
MTVGETQLDSLLVTMQPHLQPEVYVFCTLSTGQVPDGVTPICQFREPEGLTLIVTQGQAEQWGLPYTYPARLITLRVQSSLAAVGFLAVVTQALAAQGISVNPVSAYYHDHLFVPVGHADQAMGVLSALTQLDSVD